MVAEMRQTIFHLCIALHVRTNSLEQQYIGLITSVTNLNHLHYSQFVSFRAVRFSSDSFNNRHSILIMRRQYRYISVTKKFH